MFRFLLVISIVFVLLYVMFTSCLPARSGHAARRDEKADAPLDAPPPRIPTSFSAGETHMVAFDTSSPVAAVLRLFYATDRNATNSTSPAEYFGTDYAQELQFGVCTVSIPAKHEYAELERPSIWKFEFRESQGRHFILQSVQPFKENRFWADLRAVSEGSGKRRGFVFIHGYNVRFADAAYRTAQMAYDLKFPGPAILFSWPSRGAIEQYPADEETTERIREHLKHFLSALAEKSGLDEIDVVCHSMGARAMSRALDAWNRTTDSNQRPIINELVLAAPDVNADVFKDVIAPKLSAFCSRTTIYCNSKDWALDKSRQFHGGHVRLGEGGSLVTIFPGLNQIDVVDATAVDSSVIGHFYYGANSKVLLDLQAVLNGKSLQERGLFAASTGGYYLFP